MPEWKDYPAAVDPSRHGVVGCIKQLERVHSPQLGNDRDLLVYLPPSYDDGSNARYPVVYMHDGQNLFDPATSFAGEWAVDQTLEAASEDGLEVIVVAIPNMGPERTDEYSPFRDETLDGGQGGGGRGELYLRFIAETVKPLVDRSFRTLTDPANTGISGSSMGGLISLYAFFRYRHVFGFAGVMSPSLWFADRAMLEWVKRQQFVGGRIYIDVGMKEGERTLQDVMLLRDILEAKGYRNLDDLMFVVDTAGDHSERAWARRVRRKLAFVLGQSARRG
ncbi:MAG TPA: alpha/beta hydrolase-fold protein [Longimicrobiales bacterium]|nr:alpha/beta hydrolase-fold protein [Longimicrobiales bacterium]